MTMRSDTADAGPPAAAALSQRVDAEVDRMREALLHLIEFSTMSQREVEQRLRQGGCGTDLGRLLSGRLDLKMKHVLSICRVIELEPLELVQIALQPRPGQRSPLLRRLEALLPYARPETDPPAPPPKAPDVAALLLRVQDLMERLDDLMGEAPRPAAPERAHSPAQSPAPNPGVEERRERTCPSLPGRDAMRHRTAYGRRSTPPPRS
jgi:hypothetical protein